MLKTIKLKLKTERFVKSPCIGFDLEKIKDPKIAEMFQAKVGGKVAALCVLGSDVDTIANSLKEGLLSTAEEVLGRQRKKIQPWVTHEVLDLRPETAAETTEVQRHCRTTVVQKKTEQRSQEEDEDSKGRVD